MISYDVPNYLIDSTDLVVFESNIDSISEIASSAFRSSLSNFLSEEHRVFGLVELLIVWIFLFVSQEGTNGLGVEGDQVEHV